MTFSINVDADVYVALNDSGPKPSWVDGTWTDTGNNLDSRESTTSVKTYSIYTKRFAAGQVSLGPWNSSTSMYTVIVK